MSQPLLSAIARGAIATSLVLVAGFAFAASGFIVTQQQEASVSTSMTRADVRALLGRPSHNLKYHNEPGRTWTYGVVGTGVPDDTVFDVDFSSDGKVLHTAERVEHLLGEHGAGNQ